VDCAESVKSLTSILQYSPLIEAEFDVILNTGRLDSRTGVAVCGFIDAAKRILVKKQGDFM
jgi:hypothetical protein